MDNDYLEFVRRNKHLFINRTITGLRFLESRLAIFMAGTPGSGKTEVADALAAVYPNAMARIDADEYRKLIPEYTPERASDFQRAATRAVNEVFNYVVRHGYSFILDGTFASSQSISNIDRVLKHGYLPTIVFVYQDPKAAWNFTRIRVARHDRDVPKDAFIKSYFRLRENFQDVVERCSGQYSAVRIVLVEKDYDNRTRQVVYDVDQISKILQPMYSLESLREMLDN